MINHLNDTELQVTKDFGELSIPSKDSRLRLTAMILQLFRLWGIDTNAQSALLGLSPKSKTIDTYLLGTKAVPNSPDLLDRIGHLLAIHKCLRTLYPHDHDLAYTWVSCPNRAFDGQSPLSMMMAYRFGGLLRIKARLEHACVH